MTTTDSLLTGTRKGLSFQEFMQSLTFTEFLIGFGTLWRIGEEDEDEPEVAKYRPWRLWRGYEGGAGQNDVAWMLPLVRIFRSPKARQKGMSEIVSMYIAYVLMREGNINAKAFGASSKQTKELMEVRFKTKIDGLYAVYPEIPWPKWEIGVDRAENTANGSFFQVYSSENTAAHGGSPRITLLDEAQNFPANDYKEVMKGIGPSLRLKNQLFILGTARAGSEFNISVDSARKRMPSLRKNVWLTPERTPDGRYHESGMIFLNDDLDPTHRTKAWKENELAEIHGGDVVAFKSQHPDTIDDMFLSHEGLVISSWSDERHVVELPVIWQPHHEFYLVYDHGSTEGHPAVALFMQYDPWQDFVYVFDEVFIRGRELAFVAAKVKEKLAEWRKQWKGGGPKVRAYGDVRGRYGHRQVDEILLEETGIAFMGVSKQDEAARLELAKLRHFRGQGLHGMASGGIATWVGERRGGIAYSPRCAGSIKQISKLRYKEGKDVPADLENDALDAEKYGLYEISRREPTKEPTWQEKHHEMLRRWKPGRVKAEESADLDPLRECLRAG